jgi:predicted GIY-YIG superfamily endonuclease
LPAEARRAKAGSPSVCFVLFLTFGFFLLLCSEIEFAFVTFVVFLRLTLKKLMWVVYLLKCADGTIYIGCTGNLRGRLSRHSKGEVKYTSTRLPVQLVVYTTFLDKSHAFEFEKYLKAGSGRAFASRHFLVKT